MDKESTQLAFGEEKPQADNEPVICLGMTFKNDEERREYFREELRKKLPELKKIEGFPIGDDEDIIALSDPPYYTACPNPWVNDFIEEWELEKVKKYNRYINEEYNRQPFATDVSEGKYDPLYKIHPYLTKVPYKAIMRYLLHYTKPGDIIFDGFSGSGMTGVASQLCGDMKEVESLGLDISEENIGERKTILNDISSIAGFISYHHNKENYRDRSNIDKIIRDVENQISWMYKTHHNDLPENVGTKGITEYTSENLSLLADINYITWSEVLLCPNCQEELIYWDNCVDIENGKVLDEFECKSCKSLLSKSQLDKYFEVEFDEVSKENISVIRYVPVLINYTFDGKRYQKRPDEFDLLLIKYIKELPIENISIKELPDGDKLAEPKRQGIKYLHQFYTKRNLIVLAEFKKRIKMNELGFSLTKVATQITRLYRFTYQSGVWGAGGGPLSGTMYMPSLFKELSIFNQIQKAFGQQYNKPSTLKSSNLVIGTSSSTNLVVKDNSVDYVFIDPPFGANLMYSELNILWEYWLDVFTNSKQEAIINNTQKKTIIEYKDLMTTCFREVYRILRHNRWVTVEFSNTKASVWNAIQTALEEVGFIVANVSILDKKKGTYKVATSSTAVKQDLVISAYKPSVEDIKKISDQTNTPESARPLKKSKKDRIPHLIIGIRSFFR